MFIRRSPWLDRSGTARVTALPTLGRLGSVAGGLFAPLPGLPGVLLIEKEISSQELNQQFFKSLPLIGCVDPDIRSALDQEPKKALIVVAVLPVSRPEVVRLPDVDRALSPVVIHIDTARLRNR